MGAIKAALSDDLSPTSCFTHVRVFCDAAVRTKGQALPRFLGLVVPAPLAFALDRAAAALAKALVAARVSSIVARVGADD